MAPVIYKLAPSPPARSAMIVAELIGAPVIYKDVDLSKNDQFQPGYVKKNPLHTVPFLEDGDLLLSDSHAIAAYLVEAYAKNEHAKLYPRVVKKRAIVDSRLHFNSGVLFARLQRIARKVMLHGATGGTANELEELEEAYSFLEAYLSRSEWLAGDHLTIADICAATSLSFATLMVQLNSDKIQDYYKLCIIVLRHQGAKLFPRVAAWQEKMNSLPWFHKINAPGAEMLEAIYKQRLLDNANKLTNGGKD